MVAQLFADGAIAGDKLAAALAMRRVQHQRPHLALGAQDNARRTAVVVADGENGYGRGRAWHG